MNGNQSNRLIGFERTRRSAELLREQLELCDSREELVEFLEEAGFVKYVCCADEIHRNSKEEPAIAGLSKAFFEWVRVDENMQLKTTISLNYRCLTVEDRTQPWTYTTLPLTPRVVRWAF